MDDPDLYDAYSELQRRHANELIPYFVAAMDWNKSNNMILEVGCGSGYNTRNVLIPSLSAVRSFTYAVDVSKKMIDFARAKYPHSDVTYLVADITKNDYEFPAKFDKMFSFHVLHWIDDQEKVLRRLFHLLNKNGEIGIFYMAKMALFTVYEVMSKHAVWAPYLTDVNNFIPKSQFSTDPANDVRQIMSSIGYHVQESRTCTRSFQFTSLEATIDTAMAANPFFHRIPVNMQDAYKKDFHDCSIQSKFFHADPTTTPNSIRVEYDLMIIRALKP